MPRVIRNPNRRPIVAAVVAIAFLLEGIVVPLHLTVFDHVHPGEASGADHDVVSHATDVREQDAMRMGPHDSGSEHRPHPAEDHHDGSTDSAPAPAYESPLAALPIPLSHGLSSIEPLWSRLVLSAHEPRPPPSRSARIPRAPPIAV